MGRFPIVPSTVEADGRAPSGLGDRPLPAFYLGDFTVLGLRVSRWEAAVRLLADNAFPVHRTADGAEVVIDGPGQLQRAVDMLSGQGIAWELADLAETLYQG